MSSDLVPASSAAYDVLESAVKDLVWPELTSPTVSAIAAWLISKPSEHTRAAYARDLHRFIVWADECCDTNLKTADPSTVEAWQTCLSEVEGLSSATIARRCSAVSSFYNHASKPGRIYAGKINPASKDSITRVKASSTAVPALTAEEMQALTTAATDPVDAAIVGLLISSGIRVAELIAADVTDIRRLQGGHQIEIRAGKGCKARTVNVDPQAVDVAAAGRTDGPLVTRNGERLTPKAIDRALRRLQRAARIWSTDIVGETGRSSVRLDDAITPHVLRATFATLAHEAGQSLDQIQMQMGHVSPVQTQSYIRRTVHLRQGAAMVAAVMALATSAEDGS